MKNDADHEVKDGANTNMPIIDPLQIEEILKRKQYYREHPEELISWEDAQKMIKA